MYHVWHYVENWRQTEVGADAKCRRREGTLFDNVSVASAASAARIGRPIGWICLENEANTEMLLIPPSRDAHDDSEKERRARASPLN